jgi:hypothetical protein
MKRKSTANKQNSDYSLAHVLYQKLGNDWYAFTEMDGDCFMSKVDAEVANASQQADDSGARDERSARTKRRAA